ncbi:MAG: flagellar basal body L-ring protein FlgH [Acidihalobacter sp.]|uniref:flagellar basal body L-ring protein FlgH n=1 Tax=Acidihalobacter sp. TaxID=1872108 RepID=UPI00307D4292
MKLVSRVLLSLSTAALLALGGCSTLLNGPMPGNDQNYAAVLPLPPKPADQNNGSVYQPNTAVPLFSDQRAHRVGDLITVVLDESTNATKSADTSTSRDSSVSVGASTLLGGPIGVAGTDPLQTGLSSTNGFTGKGQSSQSNTMTGTITVTVARVLSNGDLVVQGQKWLQINQGREYVRLRGIVRPADISPQNTVDSTKIADAHIGYSGQGMVNNSNRPGWLVRFFNAWWPL